MQDRNFTIRPIVRADAQAWERLRCALWPDDPDSHATEIAAFFAGTLDEPVAVLVAEDATNGIVGFAELSIRIDLPGLEGQRVGYVEGLYAIPEARGSGVTQMFLRTSQSWAREQKCPAFASDRAERIIVDRRYSLG